MTWSAGVATACRGVACYAPTTARESAIVRWRGGFPGALDVAAQERREAALPCRNIDTGRIHRAQELTQEDTVPGRIDPGFAELLAVKIFDLADGPIEGPFEFAVDPAGGLFDFFRRYFELVPFQPGGVKAPGVFDQGLITIFSDVGNDPGHFPGVFRPK